MSQSDTRKRIFIRSSFFVAIVAIGAVLILGSLPLSTPAFSFSPPVIGGKAPEFTHKNARDWFNSPPLSIQDLKGKVVLIDFWTFGCWNCYRSFPWLNNVEKKFKDSPFTVIGVHTPEFDHEKDYQKIAEKIKEFNLHHPVMVDNDTSYWRAMYNRYWPAFYLVDKKGQVDSVFVGETHIGQARAAKIEKRIAQLLKK